MKWRVAGALLVLLFLLVLPDPSDAQVRVTLGGQIDSNAGYEIRRSKDKKSDSLTWGSRYAPTLQGFVWTPRFMTYSLGGSFGDRTIEAAEGKSQFLEREPYRVELSFFPQATHSFTVRATQSTFETGFAPQDGEATTITTSSRSQGFTWNYRGTPALPSASLEFQRQTTETETAGTAGEQTLTSIGLQAAKSFSRANPTVRYRLELRDDATTNETQAQKTSAIGHRFEYTDRIRLTERLFLSPNVAYTINPGAQGVDSTTNLEMPFAGSINPTLDGTANLRYSLAQGQTLTHTVAADGGLVKRFRPDLTLGGGLNTNVTRSETGSVWTAGGFSNVSASPFSTLRLIADYGLQVNGADAGLGVFNRWHAGLTSTWIPKHTLSGNYYANLAMPPRGPSFTSQSWVFNASSVIVPRTILDGSYAFELQESDGERVGHGVTLTGTFTPWSGLGVHAGGDFTSRTTSSGTVATVEERLYSANAGADLTLFELVTFSLNGRHGVQDVKREDKSGQFVSQRGTAAVSTTWRRLGVRVEGFLERELAVDRVGNGVRVDLSYRFRVWTMTLEAQRVTHTTKDIETGNDRVMFRLTRPLTSLLPWPFQWP